MVELAGLSGSWLACLQHYADIFLGPFPQHHSLVSVESSQGELRAPGASQEHGSLAVASGPGPGLTAILMLQEGVFSEDHSEGWS